MTKIVYTVFFTAPDSDKVLAMDDCKTYEEAVELAEMFASHGFHYQIVEHNCYC